MPSTPTLIIRLLDIPLKHDPAIMKMLLIGAGEETAKSLKNRPTDGIDPNLFHNKEIAYSGIQLATYRQYAEYTAIGKECVSTLNYWYEVFKKNNGTLIQNTVVIQETYTPAFLPKQQKYQIKNLLVSDDIAKELNEMSDRFARMDKLEKYLFGNLQTFFKHIGFVYDKQQHFLKVTITDLIYNAAMPVFHGEKKTAFDIIFLCNFRLPQALRLGQTTALGYGRVL